MQRHCKNGKVIANFLKDHPKVGDVYWPGFEMHPNHEIAKNQMDDFGGMISFNLKGNKLEDAITGLAPHIPQDSPSLFRKGLWLAHVPENFPFFFNKILIPTPAKTKANIKIVIRKIVEKSM